MKLRNLIQLIKVKLGHATNSAGRDEEQFEIINPESLQTICNYYSPSLSLLPRVLSDIQRSVNHKLIVSSTVWGKCLQNCITDDVEGRLIQDAI